LSDPFVSPDWLAVNLADESVVVLEVSAAVPDAAEYRDAHIPGAHHQWWKALCWDESDREFPDPEVMAERLGNLGVGDDDTLVLVGAPIQFAAYAYWVLTMTGQARGVKILDGGRLAWANRGLPMTSDVPPPRPAQTRRAGSEDRSSRLGRDAVLGGLHEEGRALLDLRSDEEFTGQRVSPTWYAVDHGAERTGRIPGARHLFYGRLLNDDETLRPVDELRDAFASVGVTGAEEVVTYCRLSHRASLGWLILTRVLDHPDTKVYDGSWTEWGSMVGMPVER
jgi:thiosulfate/3-mercaptopyruvate sulfurtransferase